MPQVINVEFGETKTGKPYKKLTLNDERKLNVFDRHIQYNDLKVGSVLSDEEIIKDGKFWNLKDTSWVAKKIPQKISVSDSVAHAQVHKDNSIRTSSTQRDAVMIVAQLIGQGHYKDKENDPVLIKHAITEWRKWLWKQWDFEEDSVHFETDKEERYQPTKEELSADDIPF